MASWPGAAQGREQSAEVGGPVVVYKTDVAAKTTTENEIHKGKREIPVTVQNSSEAGMAPG